MIINIHDDEIDITKFIIEKEVMKSNEKQTCAILQNYTLLYGTLFRKYRSESRKFIKLTRESNQNRQDVGIKSNGAGVYQDVGQELSAGVKEKFSLDEDYDFTDEKAGAIHDTLKYSMDEEYDDWLVNDDGKNNINDLIKEAVALETTGKIGFYYLNKKRTQSIFKRSGYQLPSTLNNLSSITIIRTIDDSVNKKSIILLKANNLSDGSVIGKIALQKQVNR
ncbi:hypothetical protein [Ruminococcus bromii]|uniref:hypothetical protein n=1 Tax=Ruminococcus bromii TaxID=40518 RepID=UPI003F7D4231